MFISIEKNNIKLLYLSSVYSYLDPPQTYEDWFSFQKTFLDENSHYFQVDRFGKYIDVATVDAVRMILYYDQSDKSEYARQYLDKKHPEVIRANPIILN